MKINNQKQVRQAIAKWKATGRVGFYYPRLKQVALNGGRLMSEIDAVKYINNFIN